MIPPDSPILIACGRRLRYAGYDGLLPSLFYALEKVCGSAVNRESLLVQYDDFFGGMNRHQFVYAMNKGPYADNPSRRARIVEQSQELKAVRKHLICDPFDAMLRSACESKA